MGQDDSPELMFSLFYILISAYIIYPPLEFATAGFTISSVFSSILGSEQEQIIMYHIRKTMLSLFIYSLLPVGYIIFKYLLGYEENLKLLFLGGSIFWKIFCSVSIILPVLALIEVKRWIDNNYEHHPVAVNLSKFCNPNMSWKHIANDIEIEYRRVDKICIQTNAVTRVVATENWILKITPLSLFLVHQSDSSLLVKEANQYTMSLQNVSQTQYLNIEVKSSRENVDPFIIRINATDFKDLQDRVARTIRIAPNIKFHKTVIEEFIDIFKETIRNNIRYEANQDLDQCIGCLQSQPKVKLQKLCEDNNGNDENCTSCYCRPMWCIDCMAKWFASRQDNDQQNQWLSSKCTCPMCRATFCILDVCILSNVNIEE